jgi:outer membrane protein assembly factor BamB
MTSDLISCRLAMRTAAVAAVFSLVIAALLFYEFLHRSPYWIKDHAQTVAIDVLKAALKQQPDNEPLQEEIRKLDQQARDEYFRQQAFTLSGAGLLCGGIIVSLVAVKWAVTLRRKHPQPLPASTPQDWEASWTPAARWTVGGLFVVLAATATGLILPLYGRVAETSDATARQVTAASEDKPATKEPDKTATAGKPTPSASAPAASGLVKATATAPAGGMPAPPPEKVVTKEKVATSERPTRERPPREESIREERPPREKIATNAKPAKPEKTPVAVDAARPTATKVAAFSQEELARAWPCFRGRGGSGISPYANVPDDWDGASGKNILWKSPVPLIGNSSPVVVAGHIFLTGADENKRQVFCYDAASGKLLWQRDVPSTPESRVPVKLTDDTGYAACTMASDGRFAAAIFANGDLAAYDLDGKLAWSQSLGIPDNPYGHAASLSVYKDLLLVPFDQALPKAARSKLRALDIATGKTVWERVREVPSSWTTPIVIHAANRDQVVTAASPWIIAYDAADGKELWRVKSKQGDVAPSPVSAGDCVFVPVDANAPLLAIRADGSGDVTATKVLWRGEDNTPDICSPLATEEFVFLLTSEGMVTCYDAHKGDKLWEEDLNEFKCKASPSLVGKLLYVFGEAGKCWILEPSRTGLKRVRQADLGEPCVTCPAFQDGRMIVRGKKNLFCIGKRP